MGGFGSPFGGWGLAGGSYTGMNPTFIDPYSSINTNNFSDREAFLALRNSDGREAHCLYCGSRATWLDGENCPKCGATEVELQ